MINAKHLDMDFRPKVRYPNGNEITLSVVQHALSGEADQYGIPIAFYTDQVQTGGLMGMGGSTEECIVLFHPEHPKDYFSFVIRVSHQGTYAFARVDGYGKSKLMKAEESRKRMQENAKGHIGAAIFGKGNSQDMVHGIASALGGGIRAGIGALTGAKAKLESEANWYSMVSDLFENILDK